MPCLYELMNAGFLRIDDTKSEVDRNLLEIQLEQECRLGNHVETLYEKSQKGSGNKLVIKVQDRQGFQEAKFQLENPDGIKEELPELPPFRIAKDESELTKENSIARISEYIRKELDNNNINPLVYAIKSVDIKNLAIDRFDKIKNKQYCLADITVELEKKPHKKNIESLNYWDLYVANVLKQAKISPGKKAVLLYSVNKLTNNPIINSNIELLQKMLTKTYENPDSKTKDWHRLHPRTLTTEEATLKSAINSGRNIGVCNLFERLYLDKSNLDEIKRLESAGEPCKLDLKGVLIAYHK